jgi:hypothetical protein
MLWKMVATYYHISYIDYMNANVEPSPLPYFLQQNVIIIVHLFIIIIKFFFTVTHILNTKANST